MSKNQLLNQPQAAALLGVTVRRLQQIAERDPPPCHRDAHGRVTGYPLAEFGVWQRSRWAKETGVTEDGRVFNEKIERGRLLHHQANLAAIQEAKANGEVVPAEWLRRAIGSIAPVLHSRLGALPDRIAIDTGQRDAAFMAAVEKAVRRAREDIADAIEAELARLDSELGHTGEAIDEPD